MIWVNTDYANYLITAADMLVEHYGVADPDGSHLRQALTVATARRDVWGETLHSSVEFIADGANNDVQDLLYRVAEEHRLFDKAIADLEQAMRSMSQR